MEARRKNITQMENQVEKLELKAHELTFDITADMINSMKSEVNKFFSYFIYHFFTILSIN